jgi:hypothetical protein
MAVFQINPKADEKLSHIFSFLLRSVDQIFQTQLIIGVTS